MNSCKRRRKNIRMPMRLWILILSLIVLGGCATSEQIKIKSRSVREGVFQEVAKDAPPLKGFADLTIRASLKIHLKGTFPIELGETRHGEPLYPFLINVDGQAVIWEVNGQMEKIVTKSAKEKNPERGEGMRYILEKRIRLAPGAHRIYFSLPSEIYAMEIAAPLVEGAENLLEFKPVYRQTRRFDERFINGILICKAYFNGSLLKPLKGRNGVGNEIMTIIPDPQSSP